MAVLKRCRSGYVASYSYGGKTYRATASQAGSGWLVMVRLGKTVVQRLDFMSLSAFRRWAGFLQDHPNLKRQRRLRAA